MTSALSREIEEAVSRAIKPLIDLLSAGGLGLEVRRDSDYLSLNEARRLLRCRAELIREAITAQRLPAKFDPEASGKRGRFRIRRVDLMTWWKEAA